ncbi:unnamed protein product [Urochloa decumbens]|uniref:Uncharacterized protein n=1 Tax=Urochloa decumbens TaxID=240449 RepID=A0ABC9BZJ1_9POAL
MAAVLDAFAPYVMKLMKDMAEEEVTKLLGVSGDIIKLEENMESLRAFVVDAERRSITNMSVQRWVTKLKDAMYEATDILDLCQLEADKRGEPKDGRLEEKVPGCFQPFLFCLRDPVFARGIGKRIKELSWRLDDICKDVSGFHFIKLASKDKMRITDELLSYFRTLSEFDESAIAGEQIERDTEELVQELTTTDGCNDTIKVLSVIGTCGVGKTTLAQKIFSNTTIQEHFKIKIWLSITQHFDKHELLRTAISHGGGYDHGAREDMTLLTRTLDNCLSTGKFLLVMDDVWTEEAWSHALSVPVRRASQKQPGSRILVTTRREDLAMRMGAPFHQHRVRPLGKDDAWFLLKKQLPPYQQVDHLKDVGMEILKQCDGLPRAIKVVGGLLSTRYPSERDWGAVLRSPAWSQSGLPEQLDSSFYLSYEDLSPQLKQCFLYCSLLPKDQIIIQRTITEMWISEGFIIQPPDEDSRHELEDMAIEYYRELINRNLIEPVEKYSPTADMCSMNDVIRSFAQYMAREEALVVQRDQQIAISSQSMIIRRLSIESATESIPVDWAVIQRQKLLRVLIIINCKINFNPGDSLSSFSSLRVLHIARLEESDRLVSSLCQLKHLRYLDLYDSDISRLPDDIDRMKFLQHIGIVNCERFVRLPVNITKLTQLRSLDLVGSSVDVVPKGFGILTNLRSLFGFPVHMDDEGRWCSLEELAPLTQLRSLRLEGIEKVDKGYLAEKANIGSKWHLRILHLNCRDSCTSRSPNASSSEEQQLIEEEVYERLCPPPRLETLVMETYIGRRLPRWMSALQAPTFQSLTYMALHDLPNCTQLPDGLCQMPSLERLVINEAPSIKYVGPDFLNPSGLIASIRIFRPFPRLQELVFRGMTEWEEWLWEPLSDGAAVMPVLQVLSIESCKLWALPRDLFSHHFALRQLTITGAPDLSFLDSFPSLVELDICFSPELKRISGLPRLQKLTIKICPKLTVLEGVPALTSLVVEDYTMKTLPGYLQCIYPRSLTLDCTKKLLKSISMQDDGSEWHKIRHIQHVKAYAEDGGYQRKCYVLYTAQPYSFEAMLDSEEIRSDDVVVDSDIDIPSGLAEDPIEDELVGSNIPSRSAGKPEDKPIGSNTNLPSGSTGVDLFNNDIGLVGIQSPREEIIKKLMHSQDTGKQQLQVVSICGIGGLGKTSIAKAVYTQIRNQFKCCAFVPVSQRPADNEGIIKEIFDQFGCPYPSSLEEGVIQHPNDQLIGKLKEFLQDKRYLIVVDDIRDVSVWEMIKPALVGNNHGSGIIATTYKVDVAESIGGVYRLPLLSEEDSKILFYSGTYFGSEDQCTSQYRDLSKRILNKCGQLPLAITAITTLLPNRLNSEKEWGNVCDSIGSGSDNRLKDMRAILSRSYDDLPQHLRTCFLYLCIFPEDYVIRKESLVQRWLSEDLIHGDHPGQDLQELGEDYFYQLLDTGLIQPIEHDNDGKALACRVPGVMIDLIASLIEKEKRSLENDSEENYAHDEETEEKGGIQTKFEALRKRIEEKVATRPAGQRQTDLPSEVKRLSLQICKEQHAVAKVTKPGAAAGRISSSGKKEKSFRQGSLSVSCSADSVATLPVYKNLSVLVLEGSLEKRHIAKYLSSSRQLRCLILASTQITELPKKVGNLQFLQRLDLRATNVHKLPCTFVELKQLRCLLINRSTEVPAEICNLQDLEEVQEIGISKSQGILEGICTLPELRVLKIALRSWDESSSKLLPETLRKLSKTKLKHLSICTSCPLVLKIDNDKQNEVFQHIEKLEIQHSMFDRLPTWIGKLSNLKYLSIEVYLLEKDALRILGSLGDLRFLSLTAKKTPEVRPAAKRNTEVTPDTEDRLVVGSSGFGCLKTFHLFSRTIGIKFEQGCMKNLERFKLSFQASLTKDDFSFGLENLSSLKHVQVEIICFSATEEAVKNAEDAIRDKILGSPNLPRPALDMRRSGEEYMIEDKKEFREEMRDLICASWDRRTATTQKEGNKRMPEQKI